MSKLRVKMSGRFSLTSGNEERDIKLHKKAKELFCYLMIFRNKPHHREKLAEIISADNSLRISRRDLRKAIWHLRNSFKHYLEQASEPVLLIEREWVQINPLADIWIDVDIIETAYASVREIRGRHLREETYGTLQEAVKIYKGDLMEGCYLDWCIYERERLREIYLIILDKLMAFCEAKHKYEMGIHYGVQMLRQDPALERTHRRLMRLYYLSNNRTAALRQYVQCRKALKEELAVEPGNLTTSLFTIIAADQKALADKGNSDVGQLTQENFGDLESAIRHMKILLSSLEMIQQRIPEQLEVLELILDVSRN